MPDPRRWPDRMTAADAVFWTLGRAGNCRPTVAVLLRFARAPDPGRLRTTLQALCDSWPRLTQRVVPVPLAAAPPEWIADDTFALDRHLQRTVVPDDPAALLAALRAQLARPLPEDRPLWRVTRFAGDGAATALLFEIHGAATEGAGVDALLARLDDRLLAQARPGRRLGSTPRLVTPDALLWRALQYGIEEFGEATALLPDLADLGRAAVGVDPAAAAGLLGRAATALAELAGGADTALVAGARRRSRRLHLATIDFRGADAVAAALAVPPQALVAAVVAAGLDAAAAGAGRRPLPLDLLLPVASATHPRGALVTLRLDATSGSALERAADLGRSLATLDGERQQRGAALVARVLQAVPAGVAGRIPATVLGGSNLACLTAAGPARAQRFAGQPLAEVTCLPPLFGAPPVAVAAHVSRGRLQLGFDLDPHLAPEPAVLAAGVGSAWRALRAAAQRSRLG